MKSSVKKERKPWEIYVLSGFTIIFGSIVAILGGTLLFAKEDVIDSMIQVVGENDESVQILMAATPGEASAPFLIFGLMMGVISFGLLKGYRWGLHGFAMIIAIALLGNLRSLPTNLSSFAVNLIFAYTAYRAYKLPYFAKKKQ